MYYSERNKLNLKIFMLRQLLEMSSCVVQSFLRWDFQRSKRRHKLKLIIKTWQPGFIKPRLNES